MNNDEQVEKVIAEQPDFPPKDAKPHRRDLSHLTLWMLGHAHIDLGYRWDIKETVHRIAPWTFRGVLDVLDRTPGFTFAQSQMFLYHAMEKEYPELFGRIRSAVADGRWELVGGAWCEYDTSLASGEAIIRQHLYGRQYAQERFGVETNVAAFVPDSFIRHPRTLPQILSGCGIRYYVFGRGLPYDLGDGGKTLRSFRWIGPDGRYLVAYLPFGPYSNPPLTQEHLDSLARYVDSGVSSGELVLYGTGDHGGGPRDGDIDALEALEGNPLAPNWRFGRLDEFLATTFTQEMTSSLPEYRRSLVAFATGALTSQAQIKRANALLERDLVETEALLTVATVLMRKPAFPRVDLLQLWQRVLTLQFHDILPGTSVPSVYRQATEEYHGVEVELSILRRDAVERIATRIDTTGSPHNVVIANPSGVVFEGSVLVQPGLYPACRGLGRRSVNLIGPGGPRVPSAELPTHPGAEGLDESKPYGVLAWVKIPPYGYTCYRLEASLPGGDAGCGEVAQRRVEAAETVEVGGYALRFDSHTGDVFALFDTVRARSVLGPGSNALELWEEHERATSWVTVPDRQRQDLRLAQPPRIVERNEVRTVIETVSESTYSRFVRRVILYPRTMRIDFRLVIDWAEPNTLLKLVMKPVGANGEIRTGLPYGWETVGAESGEFLVHRWIDFRGEAGGLTLYNDGAYGADLHDDAVRMSVIRTARDMDPTMSRGRHELRYSICPHDGGNPVSKVEAEYRRFANHVEVAYTGEHLGGLKTWGRIDSSRSLSRSESFASCRPDTVSLEVLKMPNEFYTPDGFVVRLRELDGVASDVEVTLPVACSRVEECDHLERPFERNEGRGPCAGRDLRVDGRRVGLRVDANEIVTVAAYL